MQRGLYFDELREGAQYKTARFTVTEDAVIRFAMEWDAQPFHVDAIAAQDSVFGGLVGSGLQTLLLSYRLYYDDGLLKGTALAGLGIDRMSFHRPLRPGATIQVEYALAEVRASTKPGRGIVRIDMMTRDAAGDIVLTFSLSALVAARPAGGSAAPGPTRQERS
ncbi:MaoC/PaaZ C-terminal domain-containing protein [Xanthobacter sp. KR7-225]|uniref:MaoC/PaaZ C-terminal domain-containing protein n=1 Tax=Xanthobacter sp. KR7-225 TaxID=3156613 RepID=UPI0032B53548